MARVYKPGLFFSLMYTVSIKLKHDENTLIEHTAGIEADLELNDEEIKRFNLQISCGNFINEILEMYKKVFDAQHQFKYTLI